jgi:hypothetical protein
MRTHHRTTFLLLLALAAACAEAPTDPNQRTIRPDFSIDAADDQPIVSPLLAKLNKKLDGRGSRLQILMAEYVTKGGAGGEAAGHTIIANNRHWQLGSNWVPRDPNRGGRTNITYLVDKSDGNALSFAPNGAVVTLPNAVTEAAIDRTFRTWDAGTQCSNLPLTKVADNGSDPDIVDALISGNAAEFGTPRADITEAGWVARSLFDAIAPNGSSFILGVTFTLVWVDDVTGEPTDMDADGRLDVALREIYYNLRFPWGDDLRPVNVDVESVALHENGHGLDLGHFGKVVVDEDGTIHHSPLAVMNAVYISPLRQLQATDGGHHCAQFGTWPSI